MNAPDESTGRSTRLITWRSGGWQLLLAAGLILLVSAWRVLPMLRSSEGALGDGRHVESYGFDLSNLRVPPGSLVAAGLPREGIPSLDKPPSMPAAGVAPLNERRRKYLVSADRVIGVTQPRRIAAVSAVFGIVLSVGVLVFTVNFGWLREWYPDVPQIVITFVNPGTAFTLVFAVWSMWMMKRHDSTRMGAIALFTCFLVGYIILTYVGTVHRGPNWDFYWSKAAWPVH